MRCIWDRADPAADLSLPSACVQWNGVHGQIANVFMILHVQQWLHKTLCFYWALEHKSALSFAIKHVDSRNARPVRSLRYGWSRLSTSTFAWDEEPPWNSSLPSTVQRTFLKWNIWAQARMSRDILMALSSPCQWNQDPSGSTARSRQTNVRDRPQKWYCEIIF